MNHTFDWKSFQRRPSNGRKYSPKIEQTAAMADGGGGPRLPNTEASGMDHLREAVAIMAAWRVRHVGKAGVSDATSPLDNIPAAGSPNEVWLPWLESFLKDGDAMSGVRYRMRGGTLPRELPPWFPAWFLECLDDMPVDEGGLDRYEKVSGADRWAAGELVVVNDASTLGAPNPLAYGGVSFTGTDALEPGCIVGLRPQPLVVPVGAIPLPLVGPALERHILGVRDRYGGDIPTAIVWLDPHILAIWLLMLGLPLFALHFFQMGIYRDPATGPGPLLVVRHNFVRQVNC